MARTRTKIEDDVDEDRIKPSRASKAGRASKARGNANADAEGEVLSRSGVPSAGADADQAARREEAAARRAARRERRAALMRALSERLSEAFVGLARFLWQYAWVFAMPLAVALAAALASYSPADPRFRFQRLVRRSISAAFGGRGRRICSLACLVFPLGGSCSVWP